MTFIKIPMLRLLQQQDVGMEVPPEKISSWKISPCLGDWEGQILLILYWCTIWVFPRIGVPQNGWFTMESPIKMHDLGGPPLVLETPIYSVTVHTTWIHWSTLCRPEGRRRDWLTQILALKKMRCKVSYGMGMFAAVEVFLENSEVHTRWLSSNID